MTHNQKIALGVAAVAAVVIYLKFFRKSPTPGIIIKELTMVDCNCFETTQFKDGTSKSVKVPLARCQADPDLGDRANGCAASASQPSNGGLDE